MPRLFLALGLSMVLVAMCFVIPVEPSSSSTAGADDLECDMEFTVVGLSLTKANDTKTISKQQWGMPLFGGGTLPGIVKKNALKTAALKMKDFGEEQEPAVFSQGVAFHFRVNGP